MKPETTPEIEEARDPAYSSKLHGFKGVFFFKHKGATLKVIASDGEGWDHISVSLGHRCPSWSEMCIIKDIFFNPDEVVIQYHPAKAEYINCHPHCLHMWKPQGVDLLVPPGILVGIKS